MAAACSLEVRLDGSSDWGLGAAGRAQLLRCGVILCFNPGYACCRGNSAQPEHDALNHISFAKDTGIRVSCTDVPVTDFAVAAE